MLKLYFRFCLTHAHRLQTVLQDDQPYELMTAMAAEEFCKVLRDDMLPTCPEEEHIWGLWGEPSSPGYQRVLL